MNSGMTQKWESCRGISPRVINIINQCKYLASKKGMSVKELRKALREDEARQRQFIRQNELNAHQYNMHFLNSCQVPGSHVPPSANHWFAHANNHGMLYSQYNIQNYGQNYKHSDRCGGKPSQTGGVNCRIIHDPRTSSKCQRRSCSGRNDSCSSEDDLRKQRSPDSIVSISSSGEDESNLVNLLYAANMSNETMKNRAPTPPIGPGTASLVNPRNILKSRQGTADIPNSISSVNPLVMSDSFLNCNLPVRKLASHNLTPHQHSSNEDFSVLMSNNNFKRKDEEEGEDKDGENEDGNSEADSDSDVSEIHIIEELDKDKSVVSPLIKKAESAFANLRKKESLFGNLDDFGDLMTTANRIF